MKQPSAKHLFFTKVAALIEQARSFVSNNANIAMCDTYFEIGRIMVGQK